MQKLSYHDQYDLSSALLHVSWMHLLTSELPQRSCSEVMPADLKHSLQHAGVVVEAGLLLVELAAVEEDELAYPVDENEIPELDET